MPRGKSKPCSSLKKSACTSRKTCIYDKRCKPVKKSVKKSKVHKKRTHKKSTVAKDVDRVLKKHSKKHSRRSSKKHSKVSNDLDYLLKKHHKKHSKPKKEKRVKKSRKPSEYNKFIGNMRRSGLSMAAAQKAYRERHDKDKVNYDVDGMFDSPKVAVTRPAAHSWPGNYKMGCGKRR